MKNEKNVRNANTASTLTKAVFAFCILHFALLHDDQYGARLDRCAFFHSNLGDRARLLRSKLVFHLHRFDDHESLPRLDAVTRLHEYFDDLSRHWRHDPMRSRCRPGCPRAGAATAGAPAATPRIHRDRNCLSVDVNHHRSVEPVDEGDLVAIRAEAQGPGAVYLIDVHPMLAAVERHDK